MRYTSCVDPTSTVIIHSTQTLVFLDPGLPHWPILLNSLKPGVTPILLDPKRDGIEQISQVLAVYRNLTAIHLVCHGNPGHLQLGATTLSGESIERYKYELQQWRLAMADPAAIFLYGCQVAAGDQGIALIERLSSLTGATVAASNTLTGCAQRGGNWQLEVTTGPLQVTSAFTEAVVKAYPAVLATIAVNTAADENDGDITSITNLATTPGGTGISLREAIIATNNTAGPDVITFGIGALGSQQTINVIGSQLPIITESLTLDAWSQGGAGYNGPPLIKLDGSTAPTDIFGLVVEANNTVVRGFVISGFRATAGNGFGIGVFNNGSNTSIYGNYIGTNFAGTTAESNQQGGIWIGTGVTNTRIGTDSDGVDDVAERNIISGNGVGGIGGRLGILVQGTQTLIAGNYIGTNATGNAALGNGAFGVVILSANNTVGGTTEVARNIISSNGQRGVNIEGNGATGNLVQGNYIGLAANGTNDLGNTWAGVGLFSGASNNTIRGNTISGNDRQNNAILGNNANVQLFGVGTNNNTVAGNFIGTDANGTALPANAPFANGGVRGIQIRQGAQNNVIGGSNPEDRNVIAGLRHTGVELDDVNTDNNRIVGNYIGVDATGNTALGNGNVGVEIYNGPENNFIGTDSDGIADAAEGNVISGNGQIVTGVGLGVRIQGADSTNNTVAGNLIGLNAAGTAAIGNIDDGVLILDALNNLIGGDVPAARNIISGNGFGSSNIYLGNGVEIYGANATGNQVRNNYIGTDPTGMTDLGNAQAGLMLPVSANNIISGNVISGNNGVAGIYLLGGATGNQIQGNSIGLNVAGAALGNSGQGISLQNAPNNIIGGSNAGEGNTIAYNGDRGVNVVTGVGNSILGNSIFANTSLGIDLGNDGITANDAEDADTGPNTLQNFPQLLAAEPVGTTSTAVLGTLNSEANATYRIEFFSNTTADPSGNGEGEVYQGFTTVTTDATGQANFIFNTPAALAGQFITATATNTASNNTSEFSPAQEVIAPTVTLTPATLDQNEGTGADTAYNYTVT